MRFALHAAGFFFALFVLPAHVGADEIDDRRAAERALMSKVCKDSALKAEMIRRGMEAESESYKVIVPWDVEIACEQAEITPNPVHDAADASSDAGHSNWIYGAAFSPDGRKIVSASGDGTVRIWDFATGKSQLSFVAAVREKVIVGQGAPGRVRSAFFLNANDIVVGADRTPVRIYDAATGQQKAEIPFETIEADYMFPPALAATSKGMLFIGGNADEVIAYDTVTSAERYRLAGHAPNAWAIAVSEAAGLVATAREGDSKEELAHVQLWQIETGKKVGEFFSKGDERADALAFSRDGKKLAVMTGGNAYVYLVDGLKEITAIKVHPKFSGFAIAFTADGSRVISCMRHPILWDAETGKRLMHYGPFSDLCHSVHVSPDGKYAVTGSMGSDVRVWEVDTGIFFRRLGENVHPPG